MTCTANSTIQQDELHLLRDAVNERERQANRYACTTWAFADSTSETSAAPAPIAIVRPVVQEVEWEEAEQPEGPIILM